VWWALILLCHRPGRVGAADHGRVADMSMLLAALMLPLSLALQTVIPVYAAKLIGGLLP
jgi:hypothetical protein